MRMLACQPSRGTLRFRYSGVCVLRGGGHVWALNACDANHQKADVPMAALAMAMSGAAVHG